VSVAPFSELARRYGEDLAIVWIDTHPDVGTPKSEYPGYHAMAVATLPDNDLVATGFGSDKAVGGTGNDFLLEEKTRGLSIDTYSGDPGNDVFLVNNKPANRDIVACGSGFDRVLADSKDAVASDCEQVSMNLSDQEFFETVPQSFFEGLPPPPFG